MNYALTIAGHDPSSGAGLTADLKTFEAHGVYGMSVCSAITVQNDQCFEMVEWVEPELIKSQIEVLIKRFDFPFIKIGIVQSLGVLNEILDFLLTKNEAVKVIWDPVLKASAGYEFHKNHDPALLKAIAGKCFLITPNQPEWEALFSSLPENVTEAFGCNILLKGGHQSGPEAVDMLYSYGKEIPISGPRLNGQKHGTGCVLSSAITSNLALGKSLENACLDAKHYVSEFISSNDSLLGQHHYA